MEYNTVRTRMLMPEYGRNVQSMAEYLLTIEDRDKRLKNAEVVIELMGILNPHLKQIEDYRHKLWDHLYQMTDFRLDVDGPYPPPTPEEVRRKPQPIPYPQTKIRHRHLGHNLEALIQKGLEETEEEKKQGFTQHIGYYMKLAYGTWHKEPVHDDMIKGELAQLTKGQMQYESGGFKVHFDPRAQNSGQQGGNKNTFKGNKNFKSNNNRNFNNSNSANISGVGTTPAKNNNYKNRKFNKNKSSNQG